MILNIAPGKCETHISLSIPSNESSYIIKYATRGFVIRLLGLGMVCPIFRSSEQLRTANHLYTIVFGLIMMYNVCVD